MAAGLRSGHGRRRLVRAVGWLAVVAVVLLGHGWVSDLLAEDRIGWGAADHAPKRIEMQFVKVLAQKPPPGVAPLPEPRRAARAKPLRSAEAAASGASSAQERVQADAATDADLDAAIDDAVRLTQAVAVATAAQAASVASVDAAASRPLAAASAASSPDTAASDATAVATAATPPASAASAAVATFDWPASTRLSYVINGNYRGPIKGSAQVQWIHIGSRYQVQMDILVGLKIAPLMARLTTSDGELGEDGLHPQHYDEVTHRAFSAPRRSTITLGEKSVTLEDGVQQARQPGVQDQASQFVQLTWLFTTHPELLQTGRTLKIPLALPKRIYQFAYDVLEPETVYTPFGAVATMHVKPRRLDPSGNTLDVDCWYAPTLQYLPVRMLIHYNADTYVDLVLETEPMQAAN